MSDGNALLALTLGAGGGLALAYLRRDATGQAKAGPAGVDQPPAKAPGAGPQPPRTPPTEAPRSAGACALRLDASGLTADGQRVDVGGAVARCKTAGRAQLVFAKDGPASIYVDLNRALSLAGVPVTVWGG